MSRMLGKWSRAASRATLLAGLVLGFAGNAVAAPIPPNGVQTPLKGNSEVAGGVGHQGRMKATFHAVGPMHPQKYVDNSQQRLLLFSVPLPSARFRAPTRQPRQESQP